MAEDRCLFIGLGGEILMARDQEAYANSPTAKPCDKLSGVLQADALLARRLLAGFLVGGDRLMLVLGFSCRPRPFT